MKTGKKWIWALVSLGIAMLSIWAIVTQTGSFSLTAFRSDLEAAEPGWVVCAFAGMLGFIFFEGAAVRCILRELTSERCRRNGFLYSASDIYFSAITPSATGGQPVCAYFMMRDGVSAAVTTVTLLVNLILYTLALLAIGVITVIARPFVFAPLAAPAKILIAVGYLVLLLLTAGFVLLLRKEMLLHRILDGIIGFLAKIRIIRRPENIRGKLARTMDEYRNAANVVVGKRSMLVRAFLLNLLQRISQISVTMFMYLATVGTAKHAADVWAVQGLTVIGSNCVPIPGAMGAADYLLLEGLSHIADVRNAANLELMGRGISFYCCVVLCGVVTLIGFLTGRRKKDAAGLL